MLKIYLDNCCYSRPFDDLSHESIHNEAAEIFITKVSRTGFDYTEWRENLWDDLTIDEVFERAEKAQEKYGVPDRVEVI